MIRDKEGLRLQSQFNTLHMLMMYMHEQIFHLPGQRGGFPKSDSKGKELNFACTFSFYYTLPIAFRRESGTNNVAHVNQCHRQSTCSKPTPPMQQSVSPPQANDRQYVTLLRGLGPSPAIAAAEQKYFSF